ncbi:unnamed protein product [Heligmosomoides polygyrus]|uniref:Transposase n=1 Tax=Heligmosomoides polygyrus TaxID=6339 RepID=A0A183FZL2_HELPZ|nr:unnamed protein product [Heligmosomoides polygyrus]
MASLGADAEGQTFREVWGRWAAGRGWEQILFTDAKLFTVEQAHNRQNDKIWSTEAPSSSAIVEHHQNPQSAMVGGGISPLAGLLKVLKSVVLPWAHQNFGDAHWTFQQDSAPARSAKTMLAWCKANFPTSSRLRNGRRILRI